MMLGLHYFRILFQLSGKGELYGIHKNRRKKRNKRIPKENSPLKEIQKKIPQSFKANSEGGRQWKERILVGSNF